MRQQSSCMRYASREMEISQLHILTDEQLVRMAQEGSETAEELLIEKYKNLVKSRSRQYFIVGADREDVVQEGMIGLFKAIRSYDPVQETLFKTFAEQCITNQILSAIKRANRMKHQPLNESISISAGASAAGCAAGGCEMEGTLEDALRDIHGNEPEKVMLVKEAVAFLRACDGQLLSPFEGQVLAEKLKGNSYLEIARLLGRSPKSIDNALQRIKKKVLAYLEN